MRWLLHFILESGEVWGGWSEPAAANHIAKIIEAQNATAQTPPDSGTKNL